MQKITGGWSAYEARTVSAPVDPQRKFRPLTGLVMGHTTSFALSRDCVGLACLRWDTVAANAHDRARKGALRRARQGRAAPGVARERAREVIPKRRAHKESESTVEHQEELVAHSHGSRRSARIHASSELLRHA
ncbi:g11126 [Coccomyxa viridis]|uniref:G11126 protein n=1 Tax=Coccomyxa viridis TaxID=1274662 RepID=A0ABP1G9W6_9CHLO